MFLPLLARSIPSWGSLSTTALALSKSGKTVETANDPTTDLNGASGWQHFDDDGARPVPRLQAVFPAR